MSVACVPERGLPVQHTLDELVDKVEAARLLGVSPRRLNDRAWRARYGLPALRVGGALRFVPRELQRWLEARRERAA